MRFKIALSVFAVFGCTMFITMSLGACQAAEGIVNCQFDEECPEDAGIPYCDRWENLSDGGNIGTCTGDEDFRGNFLFDGGAE